MLNVWIEDCRLKIVGGLAKSQNCHGKVIPPGRDQIQGQRISCHTVNAIREVCIHSVRRNDDEMMRNAVPLKRDLQSHQLLIEWVKELL